jgi:hypothetical protein
VKPATNFPPPIEWDFRKVQQPELEIATLYEYARTSDKIREATWKWLNTMLDGKPLGLQILNGLKTGKRFGVGFDLEVSGREAMQSLELYNLITENRPDFPTPWLINGKSPVTITKNPNYRRVRVEPIEKTADRVKKLCAMRKAHGGKLGEADWFKEVYAENFMMSIRWHGFTVKEITADFEKWLRGEAKNHPEMKQRGRAGQMPVAPLKWLAAYRLHKAGVTFEAAQIRLEMEKDSYGYLPRYSEKSGWSDAIKNAKRLIAKVEAGKLCQDFS